MINPKITLEIFRHAREVYPQECCGVITQKGRVQTYHRVTNVAREPEKAFVLDSNEFAEICDDREPAYIVHSHTGDGATTKPSAADICSCNECEITYVIVSLPEGDMRILQPEKMSLVGRPWSLGTFDCWGLVMSFHEKHGVKLKDYRVDYPWWQNEYPDNIYDENWESEGFEIINDYSNIPVGSMIMMQVQSEKTNHAGIYVGGGMFLHHLYGKLSKLDFYSEYYQQRTVRIVRHKDLPEGAGYDASTD
jgi:proteasome lid subunit RPN8/RPN11